MRNSVEEVHQLVTALDPVDEHPADAAAREVGEELGIGAVFNDPERRPAFLTVSETVGAGPHVDVSLWFVLDGWQGMRMVDESNEFAGVRWWTPAEVAGGEVEFDPQFGRFRAKIAGENWCSSVG